MLTVSQQLQFTTLHGSEHLCCAYSKPFKGNPTSSSFSMSNWGCILKGNPKLNAIWLLVDVLWWDTLTIGHFLQSSSERATKNEFKWSTEFPTNNGSVIWVGACMRRGHCCEKVQSAYVASVHRLRHLKVEFIDILYNLHLCDLTVLWSRHICAFSRFR